MYPEPAFPAPALQPRQPCLTGIRNQVCGGSLSRVRTSGRNFRQLLVAVGALLAAGLTEPARCQDRYCGVYSAYAVLNHYGQEVAFESLLEPEYVSGFRGSTAQGVAAALTAHGIPATVRSGLGLFDPRTATGPVILHVRRNLGMWRYGYWISSLEVCFGPLVERSVQAVSLALAASVISTGLLSVWLIPERQPAVTGLETGHDENNLNPNPPQVRSAGTRAAHGHSGSTLSATAGESTSTAATSGRKVFGISIVMPVYNEAATIEQIVAQVTDVAENCQWDWELLIVDDGSCDGTGRILKQFADHDRIRLLTHDINRGKGAGIRTALAATSREFTIIQDADLEYSVQEIEELLTAMTRPGVDVVYGSRVLGAREHRAAGRRNIYALGVSVLNTTVRVLYGLRLTDEATCYKLFRTRDLRRMELTCEGFEFCPEVTAKAVRLGLTIVEIPISYQPRSTGEGKKIRFRDAVIAVRTLWRFRRWTPRNSVSE